MKSGSSCNFFLGGYDLEMITIRDLLKKQGYGSSVFDKQLSWGAHLSDYQDEIEAACAQGAIPIAIELNDDMAPDWKARPALIAVDHHGIRHNDSSALRQIFDLVGCPDSAWTRDFDLVAANDVGHIRAMIAAGATQEEMIDIRQRDRAAQGITSAEEVQGLAALKSARVTAAGRLLVVTLPHGRAATVTDPLALNPDLAGMPSQIMVIATTTIMFFGDRKIIDALTQALPAGFSGGQGHQGFFGVPAPDGDVSAQMETIICNQLSS